MFTNLLVLPLLTLSPFGAAPQGTLPQQPSADLDAWSEDLTQKDLEQREEALDRAVEQARRDADLHAWLERAAGSSDRELAWTARMALRDLRRGAHASAPFGDPFGSLSDRLDRGFGALPDPFEAWDLFRDLEQGLGRLSPAAPAAPGLQQQSRSFQMRSGPDGVRVEVEEDENGKTTTKVYEADTLEELLEANPELRDLIDTRGPFAQSGGQGLDSLMDRLRGRLGRAQRPPPLGGAGEVPTDRLGVLVRPTDAHEASIPDVPDGVGLIVERVLPGTLASALGVRPGDVLLRLNGKDLKGTADVAAVLAARARSEAVTLEVLGQRGERRELRWSPPML